MPGRIRDDSPLPPFASTNGEIKRAVERNAINRGILLIKIITSLKIDSILETIQELSRSYDKEEIVEVAQELEIDVNALRKLDSSDPPIPYPYYFCLPQWLVEYPALFFYYRNVAMLSKKVMRGIGLDTQAYEDGSVPPAEKAIEIARYLNRITGRLVMSVDLSSNRHIEMLLGNLGDSLGGTSRNEVGRAASAYVVRLIALHLHGQGHLTRIIYSAKGSFDDIEGQEKNSGKTVTLQVWRGMDLLPLLHQLEDQRVKYQELSFDNGFSLLLDRQIEWRRHQKPGEVPVEVVNDEEQTQGEENIVYDQKQESYKIGVDFHSTNDGSFSMVWAAELKGGADPAGSDEHWKTATQALNRVITASKNTNRPLPALSFIATILVDRVAREAQNWIDSGKLKSVYNLTRIEESDVERRAFLSDVEAFLGYSLGNGSGKKLDE